MRHDDCRTAVLKGELTSAVRAHLEDCAGCARLADALARIQADLREVPPTSPRLAERVLERTAPAVEPEPLVARARVLRSLGKRRASRRLLLGMAAALIVAVVSVAVLLGQGLRSDRAVAMTPFTVDCGNGSAGGQQAGRRGGRSLKGQRVLVAGVWSGAERARFAKVLERFEQSTGAKVTFAYETRDIAKTIKARLDLGCPPDVGLLPQPGLLADLARSGKLEPIGGIAGKEVGANYGPSWRELGTVDGRLYGVWFKAANKSTFWYNRGLFRRAGVNGTPHSWQELGQIAARLRARGVVPFSLAGADGWTLTDWFENVYVRSAGLKRYSELAEHKIPWTHPSVKRALSKLAEIFATPEWLAGGTRGALATTFEESVRQVFAERSRAAMLYEGGFVASEIASLRAGANHAGYFHFPPIGRGSSPVVVGGDVAVLFEKSAHNEAARALIRFLATPEAAEPWARSGGFISPNRRLDPSVYPDPTSRPLAKELVERPVRFDLSDVQPPAFGATAGQGMWELLRDYLKDPRSADAIARKLEHAASNAWQCERALHGQC